MVQIEIIGNLGADVKRVEYNGAEFYTINVCDNRRVGDKEETTWYTCNINRSSDKLLQYLVKGQAVFVRGIPRYRIFDSAKAHMKMVGVEVFVNEIQLVGGSPASASEIGIRDMLSYVESQHPESMADYGYAAYSFLQSKGYYSPQQQELGQAPAAQQPAQQEDALRAPKGSEVSDSQKAKAEGSSRGRKNSNK